LGNSIQKRFEEFTVNRFSERIPFISDGLIHPQRCVFFQIIKTPKQQEVGAIVGLTRANSSAKHGENSLKDVVTNLAIRRHSLIEGIGTFPTRTHSGSESRYIEAKLNRKLFSLFFDVVDNTVLLDRKFENEGTKEVEPWFYRPKLPLLLIHGNVQIGSGYSVSIYPRNINTVIDTTKQLCIDEECEPERIPLDIPNFIGTIVKSDNKDKFTQWRVTGVYKLVGQILHVTEIPFNLKYTNFLANVVKLREKNGNIPIVTTFQNRSKENKIDVKITLSNDFVNKLKTSDDPKKMLEKTFKLSMNCSETIVAIHATTDNNWKLTDKRLYKFKNEIELIREWVKIRKDQLRTRIDYLLKQLKLDFYKAQSIALIMFNQIITNKINITKENNIEKQIESINTVPNFGYDKTIMSPKAVQIQKQLLHFKCFELKQLYGYDNSNGKQHDYNYILNKRIKDFTVKSIENQLKLMLEISNELKKLSTGTPTSIMLEELEEIENNI